MTCSYDNHDGETKKISSVYNDIYMRRLSQNEKYIQLVNNRSLRSVTINEMKSRIQSIIIAYSFNLMDDFKGEPFETLNQVIENLITFNEYTELKQFGHSDFEICLLIWSCSSGEMRNHVATKAHTDGNKSHPIESLTMFARINPNDINDKYTKAYIKKIISRGYLVFPIEGLVIKFKVGIDIIHSNLKNTLHIADKSRNKINWSKVNGPK